jgi:DNA-binding transcriptional ArsR family regulator
MGYSMPRDQVFKALADPVRRQILVALEERPLAVFSISSRFAVSRPAISKHLRVLSDAGLVSARRSGKENLYSLEPDALQEVVAWLNQMWGSRLKLLKKLAERAT